MSRGGSVERHGKCPATNRQGLPCGMAAGYGTDHVGVGLCKHHGGSTPGGRKQAVTLEAARQVEVWGGRLDVNPAEALLELVQSKAAEVAYWNWRVGGLSEDERAGLLVAESTFGEGPQGPVDTVTRKASPHVFVVLLHKAQDQLASFSAAALRAGVDEALVRLATVQASAVVDFARRAIEVARERPDVAADVILLELVGGQS